MFKEIEDAFQQQDYQKAEILLAKIQQQESENFWFQYYQGKLEASKNNLEKAEEIYVKILKNCATPNPQLFSKIRQEIDSIKNRKSEIKLKEINRFKAISNSEEFAMLILEPIVTTDKKIFAQKMAKIMEIDVYSARLLIPSRSLKFYLSGKLGQLKYYESELNKASIPCFAVSLKDIKNIAVYQVKYMKYVSPEFIFVCKNHLKQEEIISIKSSDITYKIKASIPLFFSFVEIGKKGKSERKTITVDSAQFIDIHLHNQQIILRLNDQSYQFNKGINLEEKENKFQNKWTKLCQLFEQEIPNLHIWSDFTLFGESVINFPKMLNQIDSHVYLFRKEESLWDAAFHLYSSSIFLKHQKSSI